MLLLNAQCEQLGVCPGRRHEWLSSTAALLSHLGLRLAPGRSRSTRSMWLCRKVQQERMEIPSPDSIKTHPHKSTDRREEPRAGRRRSSWATSVARLFIYYLFPVQPFPIAGCSQHATLAERLQEQHKFPRKKRRRLLQDPHLKQGFKSSGIFLT